MTSDPPLSRQDKVSVQRSLRASSGPALVHTLFRMDLFHRRVRYSSSRACEIRLLQLLSTLSPQCKVSVQLSLGAISAPAFVSPLSRMDPFHRRVRYTCSGACAHLQRGRTEQARKYRWMDTFPCCQRSPAWTAGIQQLQQKKLASSAGCMPYPAVKLDKNWSWKSCKLRWVDT